MTRPELAAAVAEVLGIHAQAWRVDTIVALADAYAYGPAAPYAARLDAYRQRLNDLPSEGEDIWPDGGPTAEYYREMAAEGLRAPLDPS